MAKLATISNIQEALQELGINDKTLSAQEKQALDEQGYLILRDVVDPQWLKQLQEAFERLSAHERETEGFQAKQERGTRHVNFLISADPIFQRIYTYPKLLAAVYHVLKREFRTGNLSGRDPLPGFGQQGLHADAVYRAAGAPFQVVNSLWYLDDFTAENGATRLVPGTHLLTAKPDKYMLQPNYTHPKQILAGAPAGSVLIFNGHLWHSGMLNQSKGHRRVLNCFWSAVDAIYSINPPSEDLDQLPPAVRYLLQG